MANTTLNVRIKHKYDTYSNWVSNNPVLQTGELAVVEIPQSTESTGLTPPAIGLKVGNNSSTFTELPWIQATAGDVYAWAKAADKPTYTADEISGLTDYISGEIQDTNTTYQFAYESGTLSITAKEKGSDTLTTVATLNLGLSTKVDKVSSATVGNLAEFTTGGGIVDSGKNIDDYYTKTEAEGKFALESNLSTLEGNVTTLDGKLSTAEGEIDTLQGQVTTLVGSDTNKSVRTIANEELAKQLIPESASEAMNELTEIAAWIQAHPGDAATMNAAIQENTNNISTNTGAIAGLEEQFTNIGSKVTTLEGSAIESMSGVTATVANNNAEVTAVPVRLLVNDGDVLIFEGGTASTLV